jgi:hypothetical protein
VESTVLDVAARAIYRPGAVTAAMIAEAIGEEVRVVSGVEEKTEADSSAALRNDKQELRNDKQERRNDKQGLRDDKQERQEDKQGGLLADEGAGLVSPGMGMRHYAPRARLVLVEGQEEMLRETANHPDAEVGVMLPDGWDAGAAGAVFRWGAWNDAESLARLLFAGLRVLDERGVKAIVCPVPTMDGLGEALRDRLEKAARTK